MMMRGNKFTTYKVIKLHNSQGYKAVLQLHSSGERPHLCTVPVPAFSLNKFSCATPSEEKGRRTRTEHTEWLKNLQIHAPKQFLVVLGCFHDALQVAVQNRFLRCLTRLRAMGILAVLALPLLLFGISGIIYIYQTVRWLLSKSAVQNKVVVITDATSGLGKECSRVFHAGGARLVLCGRTWEKLETLYDALINMADPSMTYAPKLIFLDISDINCIRDVAKEILNCYGCVDILINNASMKVKGAVQSISLELDKKIMDANYFGPITLTKAILPNMISRRTGQIVLINSIQGKIGIPFRAAYAASKHAAVGFFDCLRAEMEEFDISVSTVNPTFICSYHRQPAPGNWEASIWKFFFRKAAYGVHPVEVAEEVLRTVSSKKQEVLLANPIPRVAVYIRTFFPELFFAIVASGIREKLKTEEEN